MNYSAVIPFLRSFIDQVNLERLSCEFKYQLRYIWFTEEPEEIAVYKKYVHQSEQNIAAYNAALHDFFLSDRMKNESWAFLNSTQITRDGAYSDGFHPLTESNIIRAMYILNIIDMMRQQANL